MAKNMGTGEALKQLRLLANLTQRQVAEAAGTSETYLSRVEQGHVRPRPRWYGQVTRALADQLSKETDESTPGARRSDDAEAVAR